MSIVELSKTNYWYHISKQDCLMQNKLYDLIGEFFLRQASKYLKIGTCPASQNLLAYMVKI